jgi:hypothetical protein
MNSHQKLRSNLTKKQSVEAGDRQNTGKNWRQQMTPTKQFSKEDAKRLGDALGISWEEVDLEEFQTGLAVELEHGLRSPKTNVTGDDEILTAKIALAHLDEFPDYYTRLMKLEKEAEEFWGQKRRN